jgi:hypothetical protein
MIIDSSFDYETKDVCRLHKRFEEYSPIQSAKRVIKVLAFTNDLFDV